MLVLALIIAWGRSTQSEVTHIMESGTWSESSVLWHKASAGSLPGLGADLAILNVFNIYAQVTSGKQSGETWKMALLDKLHIAQSLDPYFNDTYRLTEGLLAYEAGKFDKAIDILAASVPFLHQYEPLMVAAFIAHQDIHDQQLAASLARQAAMQPDAPPLALSYAAKLTSKAAGCRFAIAFLQARINVTPITYRQHILNKIKKIREGEACQQEIADSL